MAKQLFECGLCGGLTPLIRKTKSLNDGIKHEYAECVKCKGKTTIMYTNSKIRVMLAKQRVTPAGNLKVALSDRITKEIAILAKEME